MGINYVGLLIFDLDGTLLKSNRLNFEAVKRALADIGWEVPLTQERVDGLMGETNDNFYRQILPADKFLEKEKLRKIIHGYDAPMITEYGESFPGVLETLKALKRRGYKLALYSYAWVDYFNAAISALGLGGIFDYAECTEDKGMTKVEVVEKIKKHFPELKTAIIGDSIHDINTARNTGSIAIGAGYGYGGKELEAADIVIDSFPELLEIFDRWLPIFEKIENTINKTKSKDRAFVVGVNGIDTSGKTEFAKGLKNYLLAQNRKVQVINLDDFHNPKAVRYSGSDQADNYYTRSFNIGTILDKLLIPARKGKVAVEFTALNLLTDKYELQRNYDFDQDTIIIFEGVFIFRKELAPYLDYKIFIDIPFEECKSRAMVRDVPTLGIEVMEKYDSKYIPAQKRYLAEFPPEEIADMVVDNSNWECPIIKKAR